MPFALACRVRFLNQLSVQSGGLDIILHKTASTSDWGGGWGGGGDDSGLVFNHCYSDSAN